MDYLERYLSWMKARRGDLSSLKFAVDCSNGMASLLAAELFPGAIIINDTVDGAFPAHSPNPLNADSRRQISELVVGKGLDCGVIFDGDADRAMFVDEKGAFVQCDYLVPVVARASAKRGDKIIHDVRTSRGAVETLEEFGFTPVMVPVGHAFAKPILRECGAACGGELAGHYYFREFFGCDSGVLATLRILGEIAKAKTGGMTFSEMMHPIVSRYENSGEINFRVEDKEAAIARAMAVIAGSFPPEISRSEMDGVRIEFEEGWVNIRKSNTEPYLRLIVERRENLAEWVDAVKSAIEGGGFHAG